VQNNSLHRARLEKSLSGGSLDRPPVALWRHFPVDDQTPDGLAAATAAFQNQFDFDLIKVTPASSYCIKDWGAEDHWTGNPEGTRDYTKFPITNPADWDKLTVLPPTSGSLGRQLECLRLLMREFSPHTPIIQTIFSPLAQAKNLVGKENLYQHLRNHPAELHRGLETITTTTLQYIEELKKLGVDGIFFAVQHARPDLISETEFIEFGEKYDLQLMDAASGFWLNMVHLHGEPVMFDRVSRYPSAILNWHDRATPPNLSDAQISYPGMVCGGLRQWQTMVLGDPRQVREEALDAIRSTGGKRFMLGTGCVMPITSPYGNILAARQSVEIA